MALRCQDNFITTTVKNTMMTPQKYKIFNRYLLLTILLFVSLEDVLGHRTICLEKERRALLDFKNELIDEYDRLSSWGAGENRRECCKWRGVRCDNRTNHVTRLNLRGPRRSSAYPFEDSFAPLRGEISPSLLELKHLTHLDLSRNDFGPSRLPDFIGSLGELRYLKLSRANFSGQIPQHIGNLSKLIYLDVSWNINVFCRNLDWVSHLHLLEYLDLSVVELGDATNWLQAISNLSSIRELYMRDCYLHNPHSLPSINTSTPLAILDLSSNELSTASLIYWLSNFGRNLKWIDISFSFHRDGPQPHSSGNMLLSHTHIHPFGNLRYLSLGENYLPGQGGQLSKLIMNLFGPFGNKLRYLDLSYNNLSGSLPDMSRFSYLRELRLNHNNLSGPVPKDFLLLPHLRLLKLSANKLTGPVPDLSSCSSLKKLFLDNNMFNGSLTERIGLLSELEALSLHSNRLEGVITDHMMNLSRLGYLDLSFNLILAVNFSHLWVPPFQLYYIRLTQCKIGPRFPKWLRKQKEISYLDISNTNIRDTVPSWFGELALNLWYLNASNNQMYGGFPNISLSGHNTVILLNLSSQGHPYFGSTLDFSRNKMSSSLSSLCHFTSWRFVDLSDNKLSGQIPDCFASFGKLMYLNVANNNLSGPIPNSFGSLQYLRWLILRHNSLSGTIPKSLSNCTNLQIFDIGMNRLTGSIPGWIGRDLRILVSLSLRYNDFTGSIPLSLCGLADLQILDLSSNKVSGAIPKCIYNLTAMKIEHHEYTLLDNYTTEFLADSISGGDSSDFLSLSEHLHSIYLRWKGNEVNYTSSQHVFANFIDLSHNTLSGEVPDEMTKLVSLHVLNLSRNSFAGHIPENITLLKSLEVFDLSWNNISGSIPTGLSELHFLEVLNLSYNNLSGRIPPQVLKFDESSYIGNDLLCGRPILKRSCPEDDQTHQHSNSNSEGNNLEPEDDEFFTRGLYIGMGLGFIFGFWSIVGIMIVNKSFRFAVFKLVSDVGDYVYLIIVLKKNRLRRYFTNE